jgi:hypothetical protein
MLVKDGNRRSDAKLLDVIRRVELALGEVRVVERRYKGTVLDSMVVNKDALLRARRVYTRATEYVAEVRLHEGTASGRVVGDRKVVADACTRLRNLERQLVGLESL